MREGQTVVERRRERIYGIDKLPSANCSICFVHQTLKRHLELSVVYRKMSKKIVLQMRGQGYRVYFTISFFFFLTNDYCLENERARCISLVKFGSYLILI